MFAYEREVRVALSCQMEPGTGPINAPATAWRKAIESSAVLAEAVELGASAQVLSAAADKGIRFLRNTEQGYIDREVVIRGRDRLLNATLDVNYRPRR